MKGHKEMSIVSLPAAISIHGVPTVGEWATKAMLERKSLRKLNPGVEEKAKASHTHKNSVPRIVGPYINHISL